MLSAQDSLVIIIDIQDKLVASLNKHKAVNNAVKMVNAARILDIPLLVCEQYPQGLGTTIPSLKAYIPENTETVEKTYFNLLLEDGLPEKIKSYSKKQIVIFGIETHICIYQTASALVEQGYDVYVIKDACASRSKDEFKQGIEAMRDNGVKISCVEIALFEWLKGSRHPKFKEVQALIK